VIGGVPVQPVDRVARHELLDVDDARRSSFTSSKSSLSSRTYSPWRLRYPLPGRLVETSSPVPASTVCILMRLLVLGLIRLKRTVSASVVAGYSATGQVTSDSLRCAFPRRTCSHSDPLPWRGIQHRSFAFVGRRDGHILRFSTSRGSFPVWSGTG
jgi:hypothetical protein